MRQGRGVERRTSGSGRLDALFFTFSALSAIWLAYLLLDAAIRPGWPWLLLIVFWVFFSYLVLPRVHRILTRLYLPGYFIGRARTSDGLLADPVNLALLGREEQVHQMLRIAGWIRADDISVSSTRRIVLATLRRQSYPRAPVSPLVLFDRQQDFAYQQEVAGSPAQRHHVRFWRCPTGWMLPGGQPADWVAAATFDRKVGLSLFTLQITHKIAEDTDVERDFLLRSVTASNPTVEVEVISNFSTGYHSRNGGGDLIQTDGDLPIVVATGVQAPPSLHPQSTDSRNRRPAQTVFGAGVSMLRAVTYLVAAIVILAPTEYLVAAADRGIALASDGRLQLGPTAAAVLAVAAIVDLVLAIAVLSGTNWARVWLMSVCVCSTTVAFLAHVRDRDAVTLAHLPVVGSSILVLLALSSHRAREYATGQRD
ncbi:LssY C-terminal domain-containing protein [Nocardioides cavernae]|uniref:LssY C-terminal domain-containing protein n=1 Tax=Nocardioides cavernae TaxID=1921566 RepID=A0ABR8NGX5_9ACTN|nr:LssY C-terminal domain-containing protein [Nocardioides cavernae]MBD3926400.1 LssY C-terminal domain-containing protein [Nocardioides cavernae]MBM7512117.1 hypothetical protein [Nocardioides cavernae]